MSNFITSFLFQLKMFWLINIRYYASRDEEHLVELYDSINKRKTRIKGEVIKNMLTGPNQKKWVFFYIKCKQRSTKLLPHCDVTKKIIKDRRVFLGLFILDAPICLKTKNTRTRSIKITIPPTCVNIGIETRKKGLHVQKIR